MSRNSEILAGVSPEEFEHARNFIEEYLIGNGISGEIISEAMLVFEAIYNDLIEQKTDPDMKIKLTGHNTFGDVRIMIRYEGSRFIPAREGDIISVERKILEAYDDKVDYGYQYGHNKISITVSRSQSTIRMPSLIALAIAVIVYIPFAISGKTGGDSFLLNNLVFPSEQLFGNAILMIGAPVTFLSLLKNLTDTYIISDRKSGNRGLRSAIMATGIISILMAIGMALLISIPESAGSELLSGYRDLRIDMSLAEGIPSLIPSSIFVPFETISPFPLIIIALLVTYAFCSVGMYFDKMKEAVDACYVLFSRMLSIVMFALPFFTFLAIIDVLLSDGPVALLYMAELMGVVMICSVIAIAAFYSIRLRLGGVRVIPFIRKLRPMLAENVKINSAIDAVPFNIRYCMRHLGIEYRLLEDSIPVLAQISLNGNCIMITMFSLVLMTQSGTSVTLLDCVLIGFLVFFLSLGAPNQPGSCVIGILIILNYFNAIDLIPLAICAEVLFGRVLNIINVLGDIVTVVIDQKRMSRKRLEEKKLTIKSSE